MPALFSFLGGVMSGYNAGEAAKADFAAQKGLLAQEAAARINVAQFENDLTKEFNEKEIRYKGLNVSINAIASLARAESNPERLKAYQRQIEDLTEQRNRIFPPSVGDVVATAAVSGDGDGDRGGDGGGRGNGGSGGSGKGSGITTISLEG